MLPPHAAARPSRASPAAMRRITPRRARQQPVRAAPRRTARARRPRPPAQMREEARHRDSCAEVAEPRLGSFAVRERDRELGVATARRARQRKSAAKPRIYVRDGQRAVRLAEALDVRRADNPDGLGDATAVRDQLVVLDRGPLDRLAALRLDHRPRDRVQARESRSQKTSIENSSPWQHSCTNESTLV